MKGNIKEAVKCYTTIKEDYSDTKIAQNIDKISEKYYDIIIGAGHKTYSFLLYIKQNQKPQTKTIALLTTIPIKDITPIIVITTTKSILKISNPKKTPIVLSIMEDIIIRGVTILLN